MGTNPTRLEAGHNHVLAYCRACPPWRELAWDRPEALRAAAAHVQLVHGTGPDGRPVPAMIQVARRLRERAAAQARHAAR